jgi:hypothetical protein
MEDEGRTSATPEGTTPAGETDPELQGTTPEGEGETPPAEPAVDSDVAAAKTPEAEGKAWANFRAKYPNLEEEAVKEMFAAQWWEKTNYATELKERLSKTERELEQLREERKAKPKEDAPPTPHPDVEKIAAKIKGLIEKDKGLYAEAEVAAKDYREANEEALELKGMAKQAKNTGDEDASDRLAARADAAAAKASAAQTNWKMIASRREELNERVSELVAEQQFVDNWSKNDEAEKKQERKETEAAIAAFPAWVDGQTSTLAKDLGVPQDKHTMARLQKHVRRAMHYEMAQPDMKDRNLYDLPLGRMIGGHIKEFMQDNDLKDRRKFKETSESKLKVSAPAGKSGSPSPKAPGSEPPKAPERPKGPVPVSYLARGGDDIPEAWKRGRAHLRKVGLDKG